MITWSPEVSIDRDGALAVETRLDAFRDLFIEIARDGTLSAVVYDARTGKASQLTHR